MVNTDRLCMGCMNDNGGEKICPICGYDSSSDNSVQYLRVGTWLNGNRYLIGKVIEENGDSVVYIGWDNDSNAIVNITEYFPFGLSSRSADRLTVTPAENMGLAFNSGLSEFMELHTNLSKIEGATALIPVIDVFESNGTVYSVSSIVSGITLKDFLIRNGGVIKWEQVRLLIMPLLNSLAILHSAGIVHRGISPETVIVGRDGRLYLSGFSISAARTGGTVFMAKLATGYAAPEQYDNERTSGPAADIYAVAAIIFRCIIGSNVPDAKERLVNDKLSIPAGITETVSKGTLAAIANALNVDNNARTSSADRLKKMFEISATTVIPKDTVTKKKKMSDGKKYGFIAFLVSAIIFTLVIVFLLGATSNLFKPKEPTNSNYSSVTPPSRPQVGDKDPNVSEDPEIKKYDVPDYTGKKYSEITEEVNPVFEIVIAGKQYSDSVARGHIVNQTVKAGTPVIRDTEIGVYISLGPSTIKMPALIGLKKSDAYITLLEYGFLPDNIEFRERRVTDAEQGTVVETSIKAGDSISLDDAIIVDYCPLDETSSDTE